MDVENVVFISLTGSTIFFCHLIAFFCASIFKNLIDTNFIMILNILLLISIPIGLLITILYKPLIYLCILLLLEEMYFISFLIKVIQTKFVFHDILYIVIFEIYLFNTLLLVLFDIFKYIEF